MSWYGQTDTTTELGEELIVRSPDTTPVAERPLEGDMAPDRNTVSLFNEKGRHIGYYHKPTRQLTTPAGSWSEPRWSSIFGSFRSKAHAARVRAADRLGLKVRAV